MIISELNNVKNPTLYDTILLMILSTNHQHYMKSLYIDPNKECAITMSGIIPEETIRFFFFNMNENLTSDSSPKDEKVEYNIDYCYRDNTTEIYTREGWKY